MRWARAIVVFKMGLGWENAAIWGVGGFIVERAKPQEQVNGTRIAFHYF
jgi:hypothetical protein